MQVYHSGKNILPITDTRVQNQQQIDFPGGVLSFSSKTSIEGRTPQFVVYDKDGTQVKYWTLTRTENNITYRDNINTQNIPKYRVNGGAYDAQAELGETHTEYESFKGSVNTIDWTTEAGTVYGGYVDLVSGEVWKTHEIVDLGTLQWTYYKYGNRDGGYSNSINKTMKAANNTKPPNVYCSALKTIGDNDFNSNNANHNSITCNSNSMVKVVIDGVSDRASITAAVDGMLLVYPLATPVLLTTLTPSTLKTLRGTNNIWSNTNGNIELAYWTH